MNKTLLSVLLGLLVFGLWTPSSYAQGKISVDDVVFLLELGVPEGQIIAKIKSAGVATPPNEAQVKQLLAKGASWRIIKALGYVPRVVLNAAGVIQLVKAGLPAQEIIARIRKSPQLPAYSLDDWLQLRRAGVPLAIIKVLRQRTAALPQVTLAQIQQWHRQGLSADEIIKRIEKQGLAKLQMTTDTLLALRKAGLPASLIKYLLT